MRARVQDERRRRWQWGQALPLLCVVLALAGAGLVLTATIGKAAIDRSRARTAADAAALAGAADGRQAAIDAAGANGGTVVRFEVAGRDALVEVRVGDARATARARAPLPAPRSAVGGGGDRDGLAPEMLAALERADALLGRPVPVVSGLRTRAEQEALWRRRFVNPFPVAPPGSSHHETGRAVDVPVSFVDDLLVVGGPAGLCQPLPLSDPVHFELCPSTTRG